MHTVTAPLNRFSCDSVPIVIPNPIAQIQIDLMTQEQTDRYTTDKSSRGRGWAIIGTHSAEHLTKEKVYEIRDLVLLIVHTIRLTQPERISAPWVYIERTSGGAHHCIVSPCEEGPGAINFTEDDINLFLNIMENIQKNSLPPAIREAVKWFGNSRERALIREEERIVNLGICAEALFLDLKEYGKAEKVGERAEEYVGSVANEVETFLQLAHQLDFPWKIGEHMRRAYRARNAVVHADRDALEAELDGRNQFVFCNTTEQILRHALIRAIQEQKLPPR